MEAYFDNSATTKVIDEVKDIMIETMTRDYGNPSSLHLKGMEAERYVKTAREQIAKLLKVNEKEIIFTSGGTESNNLAILGTAEANKRAGNHIITTLMEHASVDSTIHHLEELGFRITYLPMDAFGSLDLKALEEAVCDDTILVSIMHVNNEIGCVAPLKEISDCIKRKNKKTLFHVDGVQSFGKYIIHPKKLGVDLYSVSGHKIHGPKGVGFLYVNEKVKIKPIVFGGGHQHGLRSGTENVPGSAGIGVASVKIYEEHEKKIEHLYQLREAMIEGLSKIEGAYINGWTDRRNAPHIINVSFDGVRSEVLLHSLEENNIFISAGSACSSNKSRGSRTLKNIGVKKEYLDSSIRISFSEFNTLEEIAYCIDTLNEILPVLRKYSRR